MRGNTRGCLWVDSTVARPAGEPIHYDDGICLHRSTKVQDRRHGIATANKTSGYHKTDCENDGCGIWHHRPPLPRRAQPAPGGEPHPNSVRFAVVAQAVLVEACSRKEFFDELADNLEARSDRYTHQSDPGITALF